MFDSVWTVLFGIAVFGGIVFLLLLACLLAEVGARKVATLITGQEYE